MSVMTSRTRIIVAVVLGAAGCNNDADPAAVIEDDLDIPVAEVSFTGIGTADASAAVRFAESIGSLESLNGQGVANDGIRFDLLAVGMLDRFKPVDDARRFVYATFRVRNLPNDFAARTVTLVPIATTQTLESTAVRTLLSTKGTPMPGVAGQILPAGVPHIDSDGRFVLDSASVIRRLSEARAAAIPRRAGVINVFPTGFAVTPGSVITLAFSLPLLNPSDNPLAFSIILLMVSDAPE